MRTTIGNFALPWFGLGLLVASGLGCSRSGDYQGYLPPEDTARQALTAALNAWMKGDHIGQVAGLNLQISPVDSRWQAGQKLTSYEIVKAETGDGPIHFSVRMTLQGKTPQQEVRYVVIGKRPNLWVYREEDYQHAAGL